MEENTVIGDGMEEETAEESWDKWNLWHHESSSNSSFASARTSFDFSSWRSYSSLSDAVTIQSEVSFGRHIGGGEIEEIPDHQFLPFSPSTSRRVQTPATAPMNISASSHAQTPARGRNTRATQNNREMVGPFRIFSIQDIRKATNNFNRSQHIARNSSYGLYKGTLPGFQQPVLIKVFAGSYDTGQFINNISILSRINHRNIAKLLGVCMEEGEEHLYSVHEFFPNGTLRENIDKGGMPWGIRVKVATEIAHVLTYMHSMLSYPMVLTDITSSVIYLDAGYTPKLFSFEHAKSIPSDQCHISTIVMGTLGYLDPEYLLTLEPSCKSDVYSFGVILAELLTRKPPFNRGSEETVLARLFVTHEGPLEQFFDEEVANEDTLNEMKLVALLATSCLNLKREGRPSTAEVSMYLEQIKTPKSSTPVGDLATSSVYDNVVDAQSYNSGCSTTQPVSTTNSVIPSKFLNWMANRQKKKSQSFAKKMLKDNLERYKIYTMADLKLATNNFSASEILSKGRSIVYLGLLQDHKLCAVKQATSYDIVEDILNEVNFLSQLSHKNIVGLFGFCTKARYPSIVREYLRNGSLSWHIRENSLPWNIRLKISSEIASALSYLHTSLSNPIIHGDVNASNILLDDDYTAKLSDFEYAVVFTMDNENPSPIRGTVGYIDPEYLHTRHLTCKSDVYSFGVVLAQLLTGKDPIIEDDTERKLLATLFTWCMEENLLDHFIDHKIADEAFKVQIEVVANLALKCLSLKEVHRPLMKDVAMKLELLQSGGVNVEDVSDTSILF